IAHRPRLFGGPKEMPADLAGAKLGNRAAPRVKANRGMGLVSEFRNGFQHVAAWWRRCLSHASPALGNPDWRPPPLAASSPDPGPPPHRERTPQHRRTSSLSHANSARGPSRSGPATGRVPAARALELGDGAIRFVAGWRASLWWSHLPFRD